MAQVGVSAAGSGGKKASRASSAVETTTQKNRPTAKAPIATPGRPIRNVVVAAMSPAATVGSR